MAPLKWKEKKNHAVTSKWNKLSVYYVTSLYVPESVTHTRLLYVTLQYITYLHALDLIHSAHAWVMVVCKIMLVVTLNGDYEMLLLSKCTPVTDQSPIKAFYDCGELLGERHSWCRVYGDAKRRKKNKKKTQLLSLKCQCQTTRLFVGMFSQRICDSMVKVFKWWLELTHKRSIILCQYTEKTAFLLLRFTE